jgi:hypothetical protein
MTNFPPSLSRVPGKSDDQLEEEKILRRLRWAVSSLDSRGRADTPDPSEASQDIYSTFLTARVSVLHKRKEGYASPASVAKQLKQIATGLATLERRLASADKNVFDTLRDASEDREVAKEEWLQLKQLLVTMQERAKRAARTAEVVVKASSQPKGKKGRPVDLVADVISAVAAEIYVLRTGKSASRSINRDTGEPQGEFHTFLTQVFQTLGINASPNASNLRLQETLKGLQETLRAGK